MSYSIYQFLLDLEHSENQIIAGQETAYLVIFTEEIRNGKLHFLCAVAILCISCQWYFSENIKTQEVFRCFERVQKENSGMPLFFPSCQNQSTDLQCKYIERVLHERNIELKCVKLKNYLSKFAKICEGSRLPLLAWPQFHNFEKQLSMVTFKKDCKSVCNENHLEIWNSRKMQFVVKSLF